MFCHFSCVWLFATTWTTACQALLSVEFYWQEYCSGLYCPAPGDLPDPETEPMSLPSAELAGGFFTTSATWEAPICISLLFLVLYIQFYHYLYLCILLVLFVLRRLTSTLSLGKNLFPCFSQLLKLHYLHSLAHSPFLHVSLLQGAAASCFSCNIAFLRSQTSTFLAI